MQCPEIINSLHLDELFFLFLDYVNRISKEKFHVCSHLNNMNDKIKR